MTDSLKLAEMQRTNIEFERQRHLAHWLMKSSPHMATSSAVACSNNMPAAGSLPATNAATSAATHSSQTAANAAAEGAVTSLATAIPPNKFYVHTASGGNGTSSSSNACHHLPHYGSKYGNGSNNTTSNPVLYMLGSNGNASGPGGAGERSGAAISTGSGVSAAGMVSGGQSTNSALMGPHPHSQRGLQHLVEGRKAKLRRFNSHDTSSNMFSVADFEYARLARRNEIEMKQRLQRRIRHGYNAGGATSQSSSTALGASNGGSADYSTGDSGKSKNSNESQSDPLSVEEFLERYSLPRVVRISYRTPFTNETLQSSSSNNSSSKASSCSAGGDMKAHPAGFSESAEGNGLPSSNSNSNTSTSSSSASSAGVTQQPGGTHAVSQTLDSNSSSNNSALKSDAGDACQQLQSSDEEQGELFLLYRLVKNRNIYHGHNSKTTTTNRKKGVMIPQEFPGYFSLLNDKGMPTATLYTSLVQLVRERVCKFVSVDNMPAFIESHTSSNSAGSPPATEGCLNIYSSGNNVTNSRPHYVKTTARGGQVFKLLAVYEDGKQEQGALSPTISCGGLGAAKHSLSHGREKERSRYAQLLNEQRQTLYISLSTKGKFYEIEPGVPQILQKRLDMSSAGSHRKLNPDCVHRITALVTPKEKELPISLKYISGPTGCANAIPENLCVSRVSTEHIIIACPIEDVEMQSPLHLRKLHLTKEMNVVKNTLGFESEARMLANPNVQNILKFCQFNCEQFLKMVEVEILQRPERSSSKSRVEGLKILKPLHLPKLLRREKTTIPAHEKEESIIFLSKSDLANMENREQSCEAQQPNRISEKMKVFQSTKKKWFRKQDKSKLKSLTSIELDLHAKKMSIERYSDMSKLLQERFGSEHENLSDRSCSDTETTTLATIDEKFKKFAPINLGETNVLQKSLSLQDIKLISQQSRGAMTTHHSTDTISEAATDLEDTENQEPLQSSFITEKLYNEFHVKTKQYSKSSSSLHQLLNFSLPQKLQIGEAKRSMAHLKQQGGSRAADRRLDFNIGEPVTGRRAAGGLSLLGYNANMQSLAMMNSLTPASLVEDELPYSSVRDSLVLSSDEGSPPDEPIDGIRQALHLLDYAKENIYAEICQDASAMGGVPSSRTRDTISSATHTTQISDDYGDYASLTYPQAQATANVLGNAISRVQINCSATGPVSYHSIEAADMHLGESHAAARSKPRQGLRQPLDRAHVTTVDVVAGGEMIPESLNAANQAEAEGLDNIYNTLK